MKARCIKPKLSKLLLVGILLVFTHAVNCQNVVSGGAIFRNTIVIVNHSLPGFFHFCCLAQASFTISNRQKGPSLQWHML